MKNPRDLYSVEEISQLRQALELKTFFWFAGEFLQCVAGVRTWGTQKYSNFITGSVDETTNITMVTVTDEAMALLLFENYREKWITQFEMKARGEKPGRIDGKYTSSTKGHAEYAGWSEEGVKRFNYYCNLVVRDRESSKATEVEKSLLASCQDTTQGKRRLEQNAREQKRRKRDEEEPVIIPFKLWY